MKTGRNPKIGRFLSNEERDQIWRIAQLGDLDKYGPVGPPGEINLLREAAERRKIDGPVDWVYDRHPTRGTFCMFPVPRATPWHDPRPLAEPEQMELAL